MMESAEIRPDVQSFNRCARALEDEADGREFRREFNAAMREALEPGVAATRAAVLSRGGAGVPHEGQSLRQAIAAGVQVVNLRGGEVPGAKIRASSQGMPRGFWNAPKRFNQNSFRHPVHGNRKVWTTQVGAPGWFDDTLQQLRPYLLDRAEQVVRERAERIGRKAP